MKKIVLLVSSIIIAVTSFSQTKGYLKYDSTFIQKDGGNAELILKSSTRDTLGFLANVGGGVTKFKTITAADITSGILPATRGGTGLNAIGAPFQVLSVNGAGTALTYTTPMYATALAYSSDTLSLSRNGAITLKSYLPFSQYLRLSDTAAMKAGVKTFYTSDGSIAGKTRNVYLNEGTLSFTDSSSNNYLKLIHSNISGLNFNLYGSNSPYSKDWGIFAHPAYLDLFTDGDNGNYTELLMQDSLVKLTAKNTVTNNAEIWFESNKLGASHFSGFKSHKFLVADVKGYVDATDTLAISNTEKFLVYGNTLGTYWGHSKFYYDGGMAFDFEAINPYTTNVGTTTLSSFRNYFRNSYNSDSSYAELFTEADSLYSKVSLVAKKDGNLWKGFTVEGGGIKFLNLSTDNTASQFLAKDANGNSVWRDISSIATGGGTSGIDDVLALSQALTTDRSLNLNAHTLTINNATAASGLIINGGSNNSGLVNATATSGVALWGNATSGVGIRGSTTGGGQAAVLDFTNATTNGIDEVMAIFRNTTGTATSGLGSSMGWYIENSSGVSTFAGSLGLFYSNATVGNQISEWNIKGVVSGSTTTFLNLQYNGVVRVNNNADTLATKAYVRSLAGTGGTTGYSNLYVQWPLKMVNDSTMKIDKADLTHDGYLDSLDYARLFVRQSITDPTGTITLNVDAGGQAGITLATTGGRTLAFSNLRSGDVFKVAFNNTSGGTVTITLPTNAFVAGTGTATTVIVPTGRSTLTLSDYDGTNYLFALQSY